VEQAGLRVERAFGAIDIWVNNAMLSVFSPIMQMAAGGVPPRHRGHIPRHGLGNAAALRRMKPRDRGAIVQVGSALAYRGIPLQSAYCAAKHAMQGFHDSLRSELIHDQQQRSRVMVHMPALNTAAVPLGQKAGFRKGPAGSARRSSAEIAAEAIVWRHSGAPRD